jgi:DNA repair and recombination protein RAD52
VTDALKRCLRNYGNLLGNCLYDKSYTQEIIKIKVPPPKFDRSQLHRRPEFDESEQQPAPSTSSTTPIIKVEHPVKPLSSLPPHMRPGASPNAKPNASHDSPPPPYNQNLNRTDHAAQIQTPARQLQPAPQPQHKSVPQRVSFASPKRDSDESFSYSDDDAFLAQVDLGEGDTGRPIDYGEGVGEVSAGATVGMSGSDLSVGSNAPKDHMSIAARGSMGPPSSVIRASNGNPQMQAQQRQEAYSTSTSNPSTSSAHIQNDSTSNAAKSHYSNSSNPSTSHVHVHNLNLNPNSSAAGPASRMAGDTPSSTIVQQHRKVVQSNSSSNSSTSQSKASGASNRMMQNQNQAPHPNTNINATANTAVKRPVTPSMGGFHFPPGMVRAPIGFEHCIHQLL